MFSPVEKYAVGIKKCSQEAETFIGTFYDQKRIDVILSRWGN